MMPGLYFLFKIISNAISINRINFFSLFLFNLHIFLLFVNNIMGGIKYEL